MFTKNIFFILLISIAVMYGSGCKKGDLDRFPITEIAPQTYFKTESDLQIYANGFYTLVPQAGNSKPEDGIMLYDGQSDNMETVPQNQITNGTLVVPSTTSYWSNGSGPNSWGYLRNINYFLENYQRADAGSGQKNHYAGVARFFRAWFYFNKVSRYGDVPWYGRTLNIDNQAELNKPRDPRATVMDSVLKDLDFAIGNVLPAGDGRSWTINKYCALALKARACLYEGTWRKYRNLPEYQKFLTAAKETSKLIMDANVYKLYTTGKPDNDYLELFGMANAPKDEVILAREYSSALSSTHNASHTINGGQGYGFTKEMVNTYLMKDGTPFTSKPGYQTLGYTDEFDNRDPRLIQTVVNPYYKRLNPNNPSEQISPFPKIGSATPTGYQQAKFFQNDPVKSVSYLSDNDATVFRFGEVLLIYAEAKAELGELTQGDLDMSINKLRARVGMPNLTMGVALDPVLAAQYPNVNGAASNVILEIRRERRVELAAEGFRYDDVMRWKVGNLFTKKFTGIYFPGLGTYDLTKDGVLDFAIVTALPANPITGVNYKVINKDIFLTNGNSGNIVPYPAAIKIFDEDKQYLFPLPTTELLLNTNLKQNPGWK